MTERETRIIERLGRLGVDRSLWGVVDRDRQLDGGLHGTEQHFSVPAHIYVKRGEPKHAALDPDIPPDATIVYRDGSVTDLYFIGGE